MAKFRSILLAAAASSSLAATPPRWTPPSGNTAGDFLGGAQAPTPLSAALDPLDSLCQGAGCPSMPTTQTWVSNLGMAVFMRA